MELFAGDRIKELSRAMAEDSVVAEFGALGADSYINSSGSKCCQVWFEVQLLSKQ